MKVYILYAKENWITDVLAKEWIENNKHIYTNNVNDASIIWILSNYIAKTIPTHIYKQKKVITTIHHIVESKMTLSKKSHFSYLNDISTFFHVIQNECKNTLLKYVSKPIIPIPFWHNEKIWSFLDNKINLKKKYGFDNSFWVGSFQRDTEGAGIKNGIFLPKLEKGPDIFIKCVLELQKKHNKLKVLLTGTRRQYIIQQLNKHNIQYKYFKMCDFNTLNELYNCIDLYIVSSRVEGGPRAINECALTKTPIYSTKVGIYKLLLNEESIFDMEYPETILNCKCNILHNYEKSEKYMIKNYIQLFTQQLIKDNFI